GTDSSCQNVSVMTTGVEEAMAGGGDLYVSPNPSQERQVQITCPSVGRDAQLSLQSSQGQVLQQWEIATQKSQIILRLDDVPAGVYFLQWSSGENVLTTKLILQ
ncbi:MAG: T9SS type A sorting domain-containing protein, partial [Bacteroidota bacterium]